MAPHQQRVVDEQKELAGRIERLTSFTTGPVFAGLPEAERSRLSRQLYHMEQYDRALLERIGAFTPSV
jgi:hypothetical protein